MLINPEIRVAIVVPRIAPKAPKPIITRAGASMVLTMAWNVIVALYSSILS